MTTMLEKAARAAWRADPENYGTEDDHWRSYVELARAVLMAVRELPDEIIDEHLYDNECGYAMYYEVWQPAIDAILNEDPTT